MNLQRTKPVIGLAGGIGAGKSVVAHVLQDLGYLVIDSDARAKAMLNEPAVQKQLIAWWGTEILDDSGIVDRARVAQVIFSDDKQRERLQLLIYPRLATQRKELIKQAMADDAVAGIVIDAPLLFEAGVDKECDAVIFVDAPRDERLKRVIQTRSWDEHELAQRESAQMPVDEKRSRCDALIDASGMIEQTREQAQVLGRRFTRLFDKN